MDLRTHDGQRRSQLAAGGNRIGHLAALLLIGILMFQGRPGYSQAAYEHVSFADLNGWAQDDHAAALKVFQTTCGDMNRPDWLTLCALSKTTKNPKAFFELLFQPVAITCGEPALFTGYFEPELRGALTPDETYRYPVYKTPPEMSKDAPWLTREEILTTDVLQGRGLEIAWVDDPFDIYLLQIQGSGRIRLRDGGLVRVGYGSSNGHSYRSVGTKLIQDGIFQSHQVSAKVIRNWVAKNGQLGEELLNHNPSYVFFREVSKVPADQGPLGAMNRSLTDLRSVAIDPYFTKLGALVWMEKDGTNPLNRLMVAQDTGGVIKGPQRADIFFGTGDAAGDAAGLIRDHGRLVMLMPIEHAYAVLPEHQQ